MKKAVITGIMVSTLSGLIGLIGSTFLEFEQLKAKTYSNEKSFDEIKIKLEKIDDKIENINLFLQGRMGKHRAN